jgi:hypothetical protein
MSIQQESDVYSHLPNQQALYDQVQLDHAVRKSNMF